MARAMKILTPSLLLAAVPTADALLVQSGNDESLKVSTGISEEFADYMATFGRTYHTDPNELAMRQAIFHERLEEVNAHNARQNRRWTAGLNGFTDWTRSELAQLTGWRGINKAGGAGGFSSLLEVETVRYSHADWEKEVDYRNLSMAKDVPEQGPCGSCWAVATAALMESNSELHMGSSKRSFSAQQLVNCVPNPKECGGEGGCKGATVELGMAYIEKMGLKETNELPYKATDQKCLQPMSSGSSLLVHSSESRRQQPEKSSSGVSVGLKSWKTLSENKVNPLLAAILEGPVAISVGADKWQSYSSGIFDGCPKDTVINHAVVLFGIGKEKNDKYWLIRNSWGTGWGEDGYIRLLRQETPEKEDAFCGTDHDPSKGVACKPYPDSVQVCGMCGMLYDSVQVKMGK